MKRFEFALETVRRWRRDQAELEALKLQKLHSDLRAIENQRERMETERSTVESHTKALPDVTAQDLITLDSFRFHVRDRLVQMERTRLLCQNGIANQHQKAMEARRQYELLDKLRQKALAEWKAAQNKEQEELAAELYLAKRAGRRGAMMDE